MAMRGFTTFIVMRSAASALSECAWVSDFAALVVHVLNNALDFFSELLQVMHLHAGGRDRLAEDNLDRSRPNVEAVHGQQFEGADDGDGNDIHLRLHREIESSIHERLDFAGGGAPAFGKDDGRGSRLQIIHGSQQTFECGTRRSAIDSDLSRAAQVPPQK